MSTVRPRDSQRAKVYAAENAVAKELGLLTYQVNPFGMMGDVNDIQRSRWARNRNPDLKYMPFCISRTKYPVRCWAPDFLEYPMPQDGQWMLGLGKASTHLHVIHAVIHYLQPRDSALHGPEFARLYIQAVRQFLGPDESDTLARAFREHRVKARVISPEARAKARHRALGKDIARQATGNPSPLTPNQNRRANELADIHSNLTERDST